jgi:hypothetical protein
MESIGADLRQMQRTPLNKRVRSALSIRLINPNARYAARILQTRPTSHAVDEILAQEIGE